MKKSFLLLTLFFYSYMIAQQQSMLLIKQQPKFNFEKFNKSVKITDDKMPFKFTFNPTVNQTRLTQNIYNIVESPKWRDNYNNNSNMLGLFYDSKLKFYISNRNRIALESMFQNTKQVYYITWSYYF